MAALTDAIAGALLLYGTVDRVVHLSCSAAIDEVPPGVIKARLQWQVEQLVSAISLVLFGHSLFGAAFAESPSSMMHAALRAGVWGYLVYALYILGTQRDSPSHVPLFAIPELRRPRAVEYRLWLGNRLSTVRMWLVVYCLALLLPHASLASAGRVLEACAGGSPPTEWAHPFAVVVLAGLACTTHLQCSARWFWGMPLDEAEAAWRWPKRQAGEHPHQLLPPAPLALHTAAPPVMPLQPLAAGGDRTPPPSAKHALPHGAQRRAHTASKTAPGKALPDASGSLRIVCCTIGTRGDVEPFVALGRALVDRGHEFAICSTDNFAEFVTEAGL
ncbi:UGT80A2, partial [Symbiodinium sp. KB8]